MNTVLLALAEEDQNSWLIITIVMAVAGGVLGLLAYHWLRRK